MEISFNQKRPSSVTEVPTSVRQCTYEHWGITVLPRELVEKILANLDGKDLVVCKRVSRAWKDIVDTTPMLPRAFYRCLHPLTPVPESPETVENSYPPIRDWLKCFGEQGRKLALDLDKLASGHARLFPERLFFSLAQLLAETPVFHCRKVYTIKHTNWIRNTRLSPDGQYLATSSEDKTVKICARIDGQWQEVTTLHLPDEVLDACFSPTGDYCVTCCRNGTIQLWEVREILGPRQNPVLLPHNAILRRPRFSADGNYLVTLPSERTTQILQLVNGQWQEQTTLLDGHHVTDALFHPREHLLVTVHNHTNVYIWRLEDREWRHHTLLQHPEHVYNIQFSPDGNRLLVTCVEADFIQIVKIAYIYNRTGGAWPREATCPLAKIAHTHYFSPKGDKLILISGIYSGIAIWQFSNNTWQEVILPRAETFTHGRFSPDGGRLLTTTKYKTAVVWRDVDGQWQEEATLHLEAGCSDIVVDGLFSPYGHHLVTIPKNGDAKIWGIVDGVWQEKSCPSLGKVQEGIFSPDGLYFLVCSQDNCNVVNIWTFRPGEPCCSLNQERHR